MKIVGMIPARLESTRLPNKALINIEGLPMVIHTCKRAQLAKSLDEVYLVTDSEEIREAGERHNIMTIMTGRHHKTGSDRLAEACQKVDCDIVVNIQGDEPLVNPAHIDKITAAMVKDNSLNIAVGVTTFTKRDSFSDIKAVLDLKGDILYCSRTDIPSDSRTSVKERLKLCFIVPFRKKFLLQYSIWPSTPLELIEFNEYLRVLEHGIKIRAVEIQDAVISVDTAEELEAVKNLMRNDKIKPLYAQK